MFPTGVPGILMPKKCHGPAFRTKLCRTAHEIAGIEVNSTNSLYHWQILFNT